MTNIPSHALYRANLNYGMIIDSTWGLSAICKIDHCTVSSLETLKTFVSGIFFYILRRQAVTLNVARVVIFVHIVL